MDKIDNKIKEDKAIIQNKEKIKKKKTKRNQLNLKINQEVKKMNKKKKLEMPKLILELKCIKDLCNYLKREIKKKKKKNKEILNSFSKNDTFK